MSVYAEVDTSGIAGIFDNLPDSIESGVKISGESVAWGLVWEWGSSRLFKPGPKTLWGQNPDGEKAIMTITAPFGYIRIHEDDYRKILKEEFSKLKFGVIAIDQWEKRIEEMMNIAADRCATIIRNAAPIDTGQLRSEILAAEVGDPSLTDEGSTGGEFEITSWQ